jgi:hypothetical protein
MAKVEIDEIPESVYRILVARAEKANQPLPDYLRAVLGASAHELTLEEEFEHARR